MAIRKGNSEQATENKKYEVIEKCGVISNSKGTTFELRYVSWNGNEPKYDLRQWYTKDGEENPGKGMTLTGEELEALGLIIKEMMED